jgi:hypothetical protein
MAEGQPAVELPGKNLAAQYPAHEGTDGTQPFSDVEQRSGFQTKAAAEGRQKPSL